MFVQRFFCLAISSTLVLSACGKAPMNSTANSDASIRPPTSDEKAADFDQLEQLFKDFYGPYQIKEETLGINIAQSLQNLKAQALNAKTDEEFMGYLMSFGASLRDGHVQMSIENSASDVNRYKIPILLTTIEDKAIVVDIDEKLSEKSDIQVGDEILTIDGKTPFEVLEDIYTYKRTARSESDRAFLIAYAFLRPSYMTKIIPTKPLAEVKFKKADGRLASMDIPWILTKYSPGADSTLRIGKNAIDLRVPDAEDYNSVVDPRKGQMGQVDPFFSTEQVIAKYNFVKVYPSDASRKKFGLEDDQKPPIYAALYRYNEKNVLLVRQATYSPDDFTTKVYMKAYMALLSEYESLADVLVLDQTHNPGGSYCADFYNIFAKEGDVQSVEKVRADRKWVNDLFVNWQDDPKDTSINPWDNRILSAWGAIVEKAYDANEFLSEPIPLFANSNYVSLLDYNWKKPMLVLIDELAGSCGDMFPMLVKANKRALLFGQTTMGLGGNVEEVGQLNNSRIHVKLTRGAFFAYRPNGAYVASDLVENNGVAPDVQYSHTVKDFRSGYVDYVKAFSDKAIEQIPTSK